MQAINPNRDRACNITRDSKKIFSLVFTHFRFESSVYNGYWIEFERENCSQIKMKFQTEKGVTNKITINIPKKFNSKR